MAMPNASFSWAEAIARERGLDLEISEPDVSLLAVQGPKAETVVASIFGDWVCELKDFWFKETEINGIPVAVVRSGWSKQGGFEIYLMDGSKGSALWNIVNRRKQMTSALHFIRRNGAAFTSTFSLATVALLSQPGLAQTASVGCSTDALASGIYQMPDGDVVRSYRLYVPANYDPTKPTPMIMVFHGWGGDENSILDHEVVTRLADEQGYILVAPRGVGLEGGDANYN